MALELMNVQVSRAVIRLTDTVTVNFVLKNNSGSRITEVNIAAVLRKSAFGADSTLMSPQTLVSGKVSIANGASKEFTCSFLPNAAMRGSFAQWQTEYPDVHAADVELRVITTDANGDAAMVRQNFVQLYDGHYAIGIERFSLKRARGGVPDDEGEHLLADMKIVLDEVPGGPAPVMTLYWAEGEHVDAACDSADMTEWIASAQAGMADAQIMNREFSHGSDWAFMLVLSNGYETVTAIAGLGRAFANVHLSGASTGGVAFGKFSASQEGAPLFECVYPARMMGGIEGVNVFSTDEVATGGRWIDGKPLYRRSIVTTDSNTGYVDVDLSGIGMEYIRIVDSTIHFKYNGSGSYWGGTAWHNPTTGSETYDFHRVYISDELLRLHTGTRVQRIAEYTTIEYTKAADMPIE